MPVHVFVLRFGQCRILIEQVGHESKIEFWVSADDVGRGDKLPTAEPVGLNQHGLRPVLVVFLLKNTGNAESSQTHGSAAGAAPKHREAYVEADHVDVYARLILLCALRRDLVEEVEISPGVLDDKVAAEY